MAIDYTLPEKPFFYMFQMQNAFDSKRPVICHKSHEKIISGLLEHGYLQEIAADENCLHWFKHFGSGAKLPDRFRPPYVDENADNYVFLEITESGKTAIYYSKMLHDKDKYWMRKLDKFKEECLELISNKFSEL